MVQEGASGQPLTKEAVSCAGERAVVEVYTRVSDSRLETRSLGQLNLIGLRCGSVAIRRQAETAARSQRALTFLLQVSGQGRFHHYGQQTVLSPGDFTLCDNSAAYDIHFDGPSESVLLRVPAGLVREMLPTPDGFCGRRLAGDVGLASTAAAMAVDLSRKPERALSEHCRERAARHLLDVLSSAYAAGLDQSFSTSSLMAGRFWKVKLYIEEHLRDPTLSPSNIAERLKLSDRYLRTIFAVSDESPSSYILRRRLEECARQLEDPRWRGRSITDIAFSWGFNSAPHFARTFRERFDTSPRDYRQQRLGERARPAAIAQNRLAAA